MTRFLYLTTALSALIALSAPAAQAAIAINGPALDGQAVLPDGLRIAGAPATEEANGPALDGRRVEVPGALPLDGAPLGRMTELPHRE